jgi:phosphocarrier protein HPr
MFEMSATIQNAAGIHCRPSTVIVKEAMLYPGEIAVVAPSGTCDLRSVINLMTLGLHQGYTIKVRVTGPDEENFCRKIAALFEMHFDFPPRSHDEMSVETKIM